MDVQETKFGRLAAAIDEAERIGGERIGGPTEAEAAALARLWACLHGLSASTADDLRWLNGQLARCVVNHCDGEHTERLVRLVGDPLTVGCKL
jgi:hypothetical protein